MIVGLDGSANVVKVDALVWPPTSSSFRGDVTMISLLRWISSFPCVLTVLAYAAIEAMAVGIKVVPATAQTASAKAPPNTPTVETTPFHGDDGGHANTPTPPGAPHSGTTLLEECGHCHDTHFGIHWAHGWWTPMPGAGKGHGWHFWSTNGWCLTTHGICIVAAAPGVYETVNTRELAEALAAAVAAEDAEDLARLVGSPSVRWMSARAALQVLSCDGETIVGHIPVNRSFWSEVVATRTLLDH